MQLQIRISRMKEFSWPEFEIDLPKILVFCLWQPSVKKRKSVILLIQLTCGILKRRKNHYLCLSLVIPSQLTNERFLLNLAVSIRKSLLQYLTSISICNPTWLWLKRQAVKLFQTLSNSSGNTNYKNFHVSRRPIIRKTKSSS